MKTFITKLLVGAAMVGTGSAQAQGTECLAAITAMGLGCTRTGANAISAAETACWAADTSAARTACDAEISNAPASTPAGVTACETMGQACLTCPAGCQAAIDTMYADCDGEDGWDAYKPEAKSNSERAGCGAAATSTPVLFVLTAAVVNHFLN